MTKLVVEHRTTPPEQREVWWFSKKPASVVAVLLTLLAGLLVLTSTNGSAYEDIGSVILLVIVCSILADLMALVYLAIGFSYASSISDNRYDYTANGEEVAKYALGVPWATSALVLTGLIIVGLILGILLVLAFFAALGSSS